jgi:hypothetical protein
MRRVGALSVRATVVVGSKRVGYQVAVVARDIAGGKLTTGAQAQQGLLARGEAAAAERRGQRLQPAQCAREDAAARRGVVIAALQRQVLMGAIGLGVRAAHGGGLRGESGHFGHGRSRFERACRCKERGGCVQDSFEREGLALIGVQTWPPRAFSITRSRLICVVVREEADGAGSCV